MIPLCLWSGPRNVSTALMYSFAQRSDTCVLDEPLYGHYLRVSGANHPGREEVLAHMDCDGDRVMRQLLARVGTLPVIFIKHMAHHLVDIDTQFLSQTQNLLLIRDPREMLPSLTIQLPDAGLADTGLALQLELLNNLEAAGRGPVVLDSRELLLNPESVLKSLCAQLNLSWDAAMLHWDAGARPEDGVWAKHWYHAVHQSTGFAAYVPKRDFPPHLSALLDECLPYYEQLYAHAIRPPRTLSK